VVGVHILAEKKREKKTKRKGLHEGNKMSMFEKDACLAGLAVSAIWSNKHDLDMR